MALPNAAEFIRVFGRISPSKQGRPPTHDAAGHSHRHPGHSSDIGIPRWLHQAPRSETSQRRPRRDAPLLAQSPGGMKYRLAFSQR